MMIEILSLYIELLVFLLFFVIIETVIKMNETIIYLIRHSEQYRDCIYNFSSDSECVKNEKIILSVDGEKKAQLFAEQEELKKIDAIYSSNYTRAMATAKYIALNNNLKINIDDRLGERRLRNYRQIRS